MSPASGEKAKAVVQPRQDLNRRESDDSGGCQLDGEGHAIQTAADGGDRFGAGLVHEEIGPDTAGAVYEEADRVRGQCLLHGCARLRELEGRDPEDRLALDVEPLAACGQHRHVRARQKEIGDHSRDRADEVFAVVQEEEGLPAFQPPNQRLEFSFQAERDTGRARHSVGDQVRLTDGRQLDQDGAVPEPGLLLAGELHRQPRLSAAAGTEQGEDPRAR